jgi:hypothetical protein
VPGSRRRFTLEGFRGSAVSPAAADAAAVLSTAAFTATCKVVLLLCHHGVCTAGKTRHVDNKHAACDAACDEAGSSIKAAAKMSPRINTVACHFAALSLEHREPSKQLVIVITACAVDNGLQAL